MPGYRAASCSGSDGIDEVPEGGWTTAWRSRGPVAKAKSLAVPGVSTG
jgi:hypothetical protein